MSLLEGQSVQLSEQYKDYPAGLLLVIKALRTVGPKTIAQCTDPSGTFPGTLGIPADKLVPAGAVAAPVADEADAMAGPVTDFFAERHTFDNPVALNFALKYIEVNGQTDLTDVLALMEQRGVAQDVQWNELQVAQLYLDYLDSIAEDADPEALAVVAKYTPGAAPVAPAVVAPPAPAPAVAAVVAPAVVPPPTIAPPAVAPAVVPPPVAPPVVAPAAAEKPATKPKKGAAGAVDPSVAAGAPTQSVDSKTWDARTMQALRIQGQLAQFYAESPSTFNDDLALALVMLAAAAKAKA